MQEIRIRPAVLTDAMDDLAVEISVAMRRRGLSLTDVARLTGWRGRSRRHHLSRYLRGDHSDLGVDAALRVAAAVGVPVRLVCGDEARPCVAAPSIVPQLTDLSQVAA